MQEPQATRTQAGAPRFAPYTDRLAEGYVVANRYQVVGLVGHGSMGAVYRAFDRELDREVALKVVLPHIAENAAILERFKREIQLSSRVTHKNVVRVYDIGEGEGFKYVTMQLVDGEDLAQLLERRAPLPVPDLVTLLRQMCRGLAAAHEQGVVHRDLKPQNIMVDAQDTVYLTDFGLAKSLTSAGMTEAGAVLGTPHYMSPEQVRGEVADERSDVYSLGLILYQMATGTIPYAEGSVYEIMMKRLSVRPRPVGEINPAIPLYLRDIIDRSTKIDASERFATVQALLDQLETATPSPTRRLKLRRGRVAKVAAATAAAIVVGLVGLRVAPRLVYRNSDTPAVPHAPTTLLIADFENRTGDAVFDGTLEPTFGLAMEQASFITIYSRAQARRIATALRPGSTDLTEPLARLVALREGIGIVAAGSIERRAKAYALSVNALDAGKGETLASAVVEVSEKDGVLKAAVDLAERVRRALGDATAEPGQVAAAETFTAGSVEAAHAYALGQDAHAAGDWDAAVRHYSRAVELDTDLGRAYAGMATVYANQGRQQESQKAFDLALARVGRMSDREKLRTRGSYFLVQRQPRKAVEQFEELVEKYPADTAGLANLALAHFYERDMKQALIQGRRAVEIYPRNVPQRNNVGLYAMYAGDFDAAIREQRAVLELNPKFHLALVGLALSQLAQGDVAATTETYGKLAAIDDRGASLAALGQADVALFEGRTGDAVTLLEKGIAVDLAAKQPEAAANKLVALAEARSAQGRAGEAVAAAERAVSLSRSVGTLFLAGRIFLAARRDAKAIAIADDLARRFEPDPQAYAVLLRSERDLRDGKPRDAISALEGARKLADTWLGRLDLGRAYLEAGAFAEAHAELDACLKRRGEATAVFLDETPSYRLLPPVHYHIGRAQEGLRDPAAAESFRAYSAIRQKSDFDPLSRDLRERAKGAETGVTR